MSDDTQMTLFTLEGIVRSKAAIEKNDTDALVENIRLAYLDWLYTQEKQRRGHKPVGKIATDSRLRQRMAPGNTCLAALHAGGSGTPDKPINDSKGCGGVMRVAPLRVGAEMATHRSGRIGGSGRCSYPRPFEWLSERRRDFGNGPARARWHRSRKCRASSQGSRLGLEGRCRKPLRGLVPRLKPLSGGMENPRSNVSRLGEGWVGEEALSIGLYSALTGHSFPEVLSIAANHSGDSDWTASIAGQLYGAWKGLADLPNEWIRKLDVLDILLGMLRQAIA